MNINCWGTFWHLRICYISSLLTYVYRKINKALQLKHKTYYSKNFMCSVGLRYGKETCHERLCINYVTQEVEGDQRFIITRKTIQIPIQKVEKFFWLDFIFQVISLYRIMMALKRFRIATQTQLIPPSSETSINQSESQRTNNTDRFPYI